MDIHVFKNPNLASLKRIVEVAGQATGHSISPTNLRYVSLTPPLNDGCYARVAVYGLGQGVGFYAASRNGVVLDLRNPQTDFKVPKVEIGGTVTPEMVEGIQGELGLVPIH